MTALAWVQLLQTVRLVLLGAVIPLFSRSLWGLPGGRADPATRFTAVGAFFIGLFLLGEIVTDAASRQDLVLRGVQLQYIAALSAIPAILWVVFSTEGHGWAKNAWVLLAVILVVVGSVVTPGVLFESRVVVREVSLGRRVVALEPLPLHLLTPVIGLAAGVLAVFRVRVARSPDERDFRLLVFIGAFLLVPSGIHDTLVKHGVLTTIPLLDLACVGTVLGYSGVFARRARLAHGDLSAQIRARTEDLRRQNLQILEAERRVALGTLAAGVGHELNNPLAVVTANVGAIATMLRERGGLGDAFEALERQLALAASSCRGIRNAILEIQPMPGVTPRDPDGAPQSTERERRSGRVLVVDDEPAVGRAVKRSLSGHDVTLAQSGPEALRLARAGTFDLVLCDVMMPGMTGLEVYETLRREGALSTCDFVFFTGGAFDPEVAMRVGQSGVTVLPKPVSPEELARVVGRAIARATTPGSAATRGGSQGKGS